MVAILVVFVLMLLVTQAAFVLVAREVAATATAAAARRAAREGADIATVRERLANELGRALPGATGVDASVVVDGDAVRASASFSWTGPGPALLPIRIATRAEAAMVSPP